MNRPLAEQLRPQSLEEIVGQDHLTSKEGWITRCIEGKVPRSILLWGPPGSGKTTLARLYAQAFGARFVTLSAVNSGVADLKKIISETKDYPLLYAETIVFVDEIHRFNKAQQDAFLPYVEEGTLVLVGATTENPSFALNNALLSRLRVLTLNYLNEEALRKIVERFEAKYHTLPLTQDAHAMLIASAQGDGRHLLNMLENLQVIQSDTPICPEKLAPLIQKRPALYDKDQEGHYNAISALHKAVRGSDPDAALYWLARMLEGGEDPKFLARRLMRMASEDIGLADPSALTVTTAAWEAYHHLGAPEGELAFAQAVVYLALAPKSNALYTAFGKALELAKKTSHLNPPKTILNAHTALMDTMGYGEGYMYDHDTPHAFSGQHYFPEELERTPFYTPPARGFEREMKKRVTYFENLRKKLNKP